MEDPPITEDWLRAAGFKWDQLPRQPYKQWLLWVAEACVDPVEPGRRAFASFNDLGVELAQGDASATWWYCWVRGDLCGRYTRFLHVRHLAKVAEVVRLIEALTGRPFDPKDALYGSLRSPESAARLRGEEERLDKALARSWGQAVEKSEGLDPDKREVIHP